MTLATFDLLAAVVTAFLSAHARSLYRLAVHYAGPRLGISLQAHPQAFPDGPIDLLPGAVYAPFPEVVVDGRPSRKVVRKQAPLAATS
jgi:hypothetical protein